MKISNRYRRAVITLISVIVFAVSAGGQNKSKTAVDTGRAVLWQDVNVSRQDLFYGPGGKDMQPDLSSITLVREEKGGHSKKYRIRDGAGRTWVAKIGDESQSETAAVRLLSGLGYKTEINYLVPHLTIPGKGEFTNVRLEARPDDVKRGKEWKWGQTPFEKTRQMQGLMLMMALINNWDMKSANNVILKKGDERQYVISDLGVSFGRTGKNGLPLFWRIGRSRNNPADFSKTRLVSGTRKNKVRVVFNGKNRSRMNDFTTGDARWLADRLGGFSDDQIRDAFRAANYSQSNIDLLTKAVKTRIDQLDQAASSRRIAGRR